MALVVHEINDPADEKTLADHEEDSQDPRDKQPSTRNDVLVTHKKNQTDDHHGSKSYRIKHAGVFAQTAEQEMLVVQLKTGKYSQPDRNHDPHQGRIHVESVQGTVRQPDKPDDISQQEGRTNRQGIKNQQGNDREEIPLPPGKN